jgi:hypothetical protein
MEDSDDETSGLPSPLHGSLGDAYALLGQLAVSTVANIVDPAYTVVAKFPKKYVPERER